MDMKAYVGFMVGLVCVTIVGQDSSSPAQTAANTEKQDANQELSSVESPQIGVFQKASCFIGTTVRQGTNDIGKVQDIVFDAEKGRLGYAVLSLNAKGTNVTRTVPVPLNALKPGENQDHLVLNMSESVLLAASGLANADWPAVDAFAVGAPAGTESGRASAKDGISAEQKAPKADGNQDAKVCDEKAEAP
jgi:hypothetical protein